FMMRVTPVAGRTRLPVTCAPCKTPDLWPASDVPQNMNTALRQRRRARSGNGRGLLGGVAARIAIFAAVAGITGIGADIVIGGGWRRRLAGGLGRGIGLLLLQLPVAGDVLVVLVQRCGK